MKKKKLVRINGEADHGRFFVRSRTKKEKKVRHDRRKRASKEKRDEKLHALSIDEARRRARVCALLVRVGVD